MLARNEVRIKSGAPNDLLSRIELSRARQVAYISRVDQKRRIALELIDPFNGFPQCASHVGIGWMGKPDMTVADLHERELPGCRYCGLGSSDQR